MAWIAAGVAQDSRVCVYDRAGTGWSDQVDGPQDAVQTATDLHTLLDRANVPGPYVLAGHSFGGLYVLTFAAQYPDQVAGLVLLDSTAPVAGPAPTAVRSDDLVSHISMLVAATANLGAAHLIGDDNDSLPPHPAGKPGPLSQPPELPRATSTSSGPEGASTRQGRDARRLRQQTADRRHRWPRKFQSVAGGAGQVGHLVDHNRHDVVADATHASLYLDKTMPPLPAKRSGMSLPRTDLPTAEVAQSMRQCLGSSCGQRRPRTARLQADRRSKTQKAP